MKRLIVLLAAISAAISAFSQNRIFVYSPGPGDGLHIARLENGSWVETGQLCSSDYAEWGSEKKMHSPFVLRATDGTWRAVWQVNDNAPTFASAYSRDLVNWRPQEYPRMSVKGCISPVIVEVAGGFDVVFKSDRGLRVSRADAGFRHFGSDKPYSGTLPSGGFVTVNVGGKERHGQEFSLNDEDYFTITAFFAAKDEDDFISSERLTDDIPHIGLDIDLSSTKKISENLIGVFFEDISYAADGGLYAELVQNRDFEYNGERRGWDATTAWTSPSPLKVSVEQPLSEMNPHHIILSDAQVSNGGWDGMVLKAGAGYDFSFFVRNIDVKAKSFEIRLVSARGNLLAKPARIKTSSQVWTRYHAAFEVTEDCTDASLVIVPLGKGTAAVDMVSLFPQDTYKGHGLRKDLAEAIAAIHPKFVRFPGGCLSHGQGLDNMYHWIASIGEWQDRKPELNIWKYHQTKGLGFYEFFQWCEDMGAEPLPVLPAGVPCQNSHANADGYGGQQGGIPMEDMPAYCEEICNLVEWANGDPATSKWAKMRADAGHPAPFNLKYLGIGNEDLISTVFEERMLMIAKAVKAKYPEIVICGTVGPFHAPSADYQEGWEFACANRDVIDMVDEHYYESTGWFLHHRDYYDLYDRNAPKVYLGEYAAFPNVRRSSLESALCEALYLCDIERNGDVVEMASYAPLLCHVDHRNWDPDLIYFDNSNVYTTPGYETQRIFGTYSGDVYVTSTLNGSEDVLHRTGASVVKNSKTGKSYLKIVNANPFPVKMDVESIDLGKNERAGIDGFKGIDNDPAEQKVQVITGGMKLYGEHTLLVPAYSVNVIEFQ